MILDPYNITAIDYLRRIYIHESETGQRRQGAVILERAAESLWEMIAPIPTGSETSKGKARAELRPARRQSRSFPMSQFFASGGQNVGVSASTSVLPMNIQD